MMVSFLGFGQTRPDEVVITYVAYNKPLKIILKDLSKVSGVNIIFSESRIPSEKLINISANGEKLGSVLTVVLDDYDLTYKIVGDQLVIVKNENINNTGTIRIYGYIRDKISGEFLIGANIFVQDKSRGTITNENGFYSFVTKKEVQRFHFSYLGYKSQIIDIFSLKDTSMNIYLVPDGLLNEIVIMDDLLEEEHEQAASVQNLHIDKIRATNHLGGEADVFRYISLQAGVSTAADGIGGLNVRGGSHDQNLVLLDGVPLYNPGHALGIFSIFSANAIKSTSFYKGGIPARYSGRLSSVIDIHTKDGNVNKFSGDVTLSSLAVNGTLEGPLIKDRSSFIISYRRTFMDVWIKEFTKFQNREKNRRGQANYFFNDLNAKLSFRISDKTRLLFQTMSSNDDFSNMSLAQLDQLRDENERRLNWGNTLYSAKLHSQLGNAIFSKTTLYSTTYRFESYRNQLFELESTPQPNLFFDASLYETDIEEQGIKQEIDYQMAKKHAIKLGFNLQKRVFTPGVNIATEKDFPNRENINIDTLKASYQKPVLKSTEVNLFLEDNITLTDGISINAGINYSFLNGENKFSAVQPRIAFLASGEELHFKIGVSKMQQYMHLLTNNGLGFPSDVWLPANGDLPPQQSWIFNTAFGFRYNSGLKYGVEAYYKTLESMTTYKEGGNLDISQDVDWLSEVPLGDGYAYGLEAYIEKVLGKTLFGLNYTYSISDRRFPDLNLGQKFAFGLNRNHSLKVSFTYRLSEFSEFHMNWAYLSGNYYSEPINVTIPSSERPTVVFPEKNNANFPAFHRLDVGFSFYNAYKWGRAKFFLGLYNAYNRNNPFYNELEQKSNGNGFEFKQFSLLPVLPTISYSVSF